MKKCKTDIKTAKRVGLFARVVFALAAGGAFAFLAWEPAGDSSENNAKSTALEKSDIIAGQPGGGSGE